MNHTSNASSTVTNSVIADAFSPADLLTALVVAILIVPIILLFLQPQNPFLSILIFIAGLIMVSVRVIIHIVARRIGIILDIHDLRGKDRNG